MSRRPLVHVVALPDPFDPGSDWVTTVDSTLPDPESADQSIALVQTVENLDGTGGFWLRRARGIYLGPFETGEAACDFAEANPSTMPDFPS